VELSTWHNGQETYETVALATGAVLAKWKVSPSLFDDVSFANAAGTRLLIDASTSSTGDSSQLQERSLTGRVVIKYPADTSPPIGEIAVDEPSGDIAMMQSPTRVGAENILNHVIFFSPRGTTLRNVSLTNYRYCGIDRWWSRQSVLMDCTPGTSEKFVLLLVNEHAVTHVLTGIPSGYGFEGDVDGWQLTSGLFIQEASFCGEFVAKSTGWHTRATVKIPHSSGSDVAILGATHSDLLVHSQNECEPGQSVLWFNPAHAQSTVVLGPPLTKGSVTSALPDPRNYS
jgi:hypothetical protein